MNCPTLIEHIRPFLILCLGLLLFGLSSLAAQEDPGAEPAASLAEAVEQHPGKLGLQLEENVLGGTASELPLWLHANRWGQFESTGPQSVISTAVSQHFEFAESERGNTLSLDYHILGLFRLAEGEDPAAELNTGYLDLSYGPMTLAGGALPLEKADFYGPLSTGALVLSRNARPIPRVYFGVDWVDVPLTDGGLEVKGSISHGWLEEDRTVENPWLHEKDAYVRLNDPFGWGVSVYRGLIQETVWAGTNPDGTERPSSWDDFWRVFRGEPGDDDASLSEQLNALGNTVGMWDQGVLIQRPVWSVRLYHQHFFEDGGLIMGQGKDWEETLKRWRDGLTGVHAELPRLPYVDNVVYEFLYTKHQSGPGWHDKFGGWDSYWEHGLYSSGWTYKGRMIGPPLATTQGDGEDARIVHSRIVANHLGVGGALRDGLRYRLLGTYSSNHGTYSANTNGPPDPDEGFDPDGSDLEKDDIFTDGLSQWSFLAELSLEENLFGVRSVYGSVGLGVDFGELRDDATALMLTVGWRDLF